MHFSPFFFGTNSNLYIYRKVPEVEQSHEDGTRNRIKLTGAGNVACRLCKGKHYTAKCPYKDTLGNLENTGTI
jgi:translation initiation factor 3 subunit G